MEEIMYFLLIIGGNSQDQNMPSLFLDLKPDRCNKPADFMYRQCCVFPPFFTREVARECGATFELLSIDKAHNITALRRHPMTLCAHWRCVLQKYDLLSPDEALDVDKYYSHLERWTALNPGFSEVMEKAKTHCKATYRMFMPLRVCEFYNIHGCIRNFVNVQCPIVFPTKECHEVKLFFDECKDFYI